MDNKIKTPILNIIPIIPEVDDRWTIHRLMMTTVPPSWKNTFENAEEEIKTVSGTLELDEKNNGPFIPLKKDLLMPFHLTPLDKVKVVILGQDPYPQIINGLPRAMGLPFSVRKNDAIPNSLANIFKELKNCYGDSFLNPSHGDLTCWAKQGVLLLNACLTLQPNDSIRSGNHGNIWLAFVRKVIISIKSVNPKTIFVLWGKNAQKIKGDAKLKNEYVLEAAHPSGLSASRGFFGCKHFVLINKMLIDQGKNPINWNII